MNASKLGLPLLGLALLGLSSLEARPGRHGSIRIVQPRRRSVVIRVPSRRHRVPRPAPGSSVFARIDRDGNGYATPDELADLASTRGFLPGQEEELWVRLARVMDTDGDGVASTAEQMRAVQHIVSRLDRNGDSMLTAYEFSALSGDLDWLRHSLRQVPRVVAPAPQVLAPVPQVVAPVPQVVAPAPQVESLPQPTPTGADRPWLTTPPVPAAAPAPGATDSPERPLASIPTSRYDLDGDGRVSPEELATLRARAEAARARAEAVEAERVAAEAATMVQP